MGTPVWEQHPQIEDDVLAPLYSSASVSAGAYLETTGGDALSEIKCVRRMAISCLRKKMKKLEGTYTEWAVDHPVYIKGLTPGHISITSNNQKKKTCLDSSIQNPSSLPLCSPAQGLSQPECVPMAYQKHKLISPGTNFYCFYKRGQKFYPVY
jgi:hypothetical protein